MHICMFVRAGMWYCSMKLSQLRHKPGSDVTIVEVSLQTDLQVYLQLTQTWIIFCKSVLEKLTGNHENPDCYV